MSSPTPRRTLAATAQVRGPGLFTGRPATLRLLAAPTGTGLRFRRAGAPDVPATIGFLAPPPPGIPGRNTSLAPVAGAHPFLTVEHVLSALVGLGITDAALELDGPEVPIGDGSAAPFTDAILGAGVAELPGSIEPLRITREVTVSSGPSRITARPRPRGGGGALYRAEVDYGPSSPIPLQTATWDAAGPGAPAAYARDVAPARTFCLEAEAQAMRAAGLFQNLTYRDMLVFGERGPIENTLRFDTEPARHKLLDLIGDLALVGGGRPIAAEITAVRAGHALHHEMARALLAASAGTP
jgi:UDP-3-O-acyl-N-acetylglucosamine deacetylase